MSELFGMALVIASTMPYFENVYGIYPMCALCFPLRFAWVARRCFRSIRWSIPRRAPYKRL